MKSNRFLLAVFALGALLTLGGLFLIRMEITSVAMGVVEYRQETVIFASVDGQIHSQDVAVGVPVDTNQTLLQLQNPELTLQVNQIETELLAAKSELQRLQLEQDEKKITGFVPQIQDIDALLKLQNNFNDLSIKLEENNTLSLEQNLISRKQYYQESMDHVQQQMALLESKKLQRWKKAGLENQRASMHAAALKFQQAKVEQLEHRLQLLQELQQGLQIVAPYDGTVVDYYFDYGQERITRGSKLLKFANPESGFQVKTYIPEKNIDLISPGMPVRMESRVYHSQLEGYLHGKVLQIVNERDIHSPQDTAQAYYEVLVSIDRYPHPPVHGSRVEVEIIIGKGNVVAALLNRPAIDRSAQSD